MTCFYVHGLSLGNPLAHLCLYCRSFKDNNCTLVSAHWLLLPGHRSWRIIVNNNQYLLITMVMLPLIAWTILMVVEHVTCCFNSFCDEPVCFIKGQNMDQHHRSDLFFFPNLRCPWHSFSFSLPLSLSCSHLSLIYPESCPWGGAALGRLLTQEKRAFNVMSLCRKAWQSLGWGHLLVEINTLQSCVSECNGLDITSPAGDGK